MSPAGGAELGLAHTGAIAWLQLSRAMISAAWIAGRFMASAC